MSHLIQEAVSKAKSNNVNGSYRPMFFDLERFKVSKAELNSVYYNNEEENPELTLLQEDFSFAYLREDKLRTIDVYDLDNNHIPFNKFLDQFNISIKSNNLFKSGKYLSRVFRPVRFGGFYKELNIHINNNHPISETDGISLISLELAHNLGWLNAKPNMSAQFTCFYEDGLVKGHAVVSDKISSDIVIYGNDNIKSEIVFTSGLKYVSVEPVKLSTSLRLDIQSMLNLWNMFGVNQYLEWANVGINHFKEDLLSGKLSDWLDDFDTITPSGYDKENWTLRKAIYHKVDYTKYPGLLRSAWSMFKNSMVTFGNGNTGEPVFRIPVPNGKRAYLRIDLRNHDEYGNFKVSVYENQVCVDKYGNAWFSNKGIERKLKILGGADMDDGLAIISVEDNKAIVYRNPNQYGEYIISDINLEANILDGDHINKIVGEIPQKKVKAEVKAKNKKTDTNPLLAKLKRNKTKLFLPYTTANLIKSYNKISHNSTNIGYAANAEMILSIIGTTNKSLPKKLK